MKRSASTCNKRQKYSSYNRHERTNSIVTLPREHVNVTVSISSNVCLDQSFIDYGDDDNIRGSLIGISQLVLLRTRRMFAHM